MEYSKNLKFCPQCGEMLKPGLKACPACGSTMGMEAKYQTPVNVWLPEENGQNASWQNEPKPSEAPVTAPQPAAPAFTMPQPQWDAPEKMVPVNQPVEPIPQPAPVVQAVSKKEFRKKYASEKFRKEVRGVAIALYVLCGLMGVLSLAIDPFMLLDLALYFGMTLGMHLGKSKGCAIGILVLASANVLLTLVTTGSLGGYLWLIAGIFAVKAFSTADKEYEATYGK